MGRRRAVSKRKGEDAGSKRRKTSAPNPKKKEDVKDTKGELSGGVNAAEISKSEEAAGNDGGIVHPLLIPHILENIFQHIISPKTDDDDDENEAETASMVKNVQNLRLVCKQWKDTATRLYRRNRAMMFGTYKTRSEKLEKPKFLDVMRNCNLIPFERYSIQQYAFVKENEQPMKDFMRICGPTAVELEIHTDDDRTMKFTRRSFPDLDLMKLKTLRIECEDGKSSVRAPNELICLIEALLNAAGTLQEFNFADYSDGLQSPAIIQRFGDCICKRLSKTVKILRLDMPLKDLHLETLAESELKLEELHIDGKCGSAIRKFFEKQSPTLKYLKIFNGDEYGSRTSSAPLNFPRFEELLHLELEGGTIQQFSFPDTFPKLTKLNIAEWETESTCLELLSSAKKGLSLKEIHLPEYPPFPQAALVKKAAQSFPNISKIHIYPSLEDVSETLQEVFVWHPNVEELHISFDDLDSDEVSADTLFSGVSEQDCRQIKERGSFEDVILRDVQHFPHILNLSKLKKLVIRDKCGDAVLTDFTAHFVFLKMASLKELHTPRFQMSTKYLDLLRKKLTLKLDKDYMPIPGIQNPDNHFASDSSDDDWQNG